MEYEKDYAEENFSDEDFAEIDALIKRLQAASKPEVAVLNPNRVEQVRFAAAMIKKVLRETGSDATIECKQHEFEYGVGVLRVEGMSIDIADIEGFSRAAEFASNTEIYPLEANKVRMAFTFHGMLMPL